MMERTEPPAAEALLAATGNVVAQCPNHRIDSCRTEVRRG